MEREKKLALALAKKAESIQLKNYGRASFRLKGLKDIVGAVDEEINSLCIREIRRAFPEDGILGEEESFNPDSERLWVVDPLDGTVNYSKNIPLFCFALAFCENRVPKMSVVRVPLLKESYYAEAGKGAFLNKRKIECDRNLVPDNSVLSLADLSHHLEDVGAFAKASELFLASRAMGCTSIEFSWVAAGRYAARVKPRIKPWDAAMGALLVQEAGGMVTDVRGNAWKLDSPSLLASANERVHLQILKKLQG